VLVMVFLVLLLILFDRTVCLIKAGSSRIRQAP
jgi:hypothetical protein